MLEKAGLQVKVLKMRDAKDPDEFLRKFGADRFRILLEESSNRVEYQLKAIQKKYDLNVDEERVNFITEAADFVSTLGNAVQREVYGNRAAEAAKISPEAMKIEVQKAYKRRLSREKRKQEKIDLAPARNMQPQSRQIRYDNVKSAAAEERVVASVMKEPALFSEIPELTPEEFSVPILAKVFSQQLQRHREGQDATLTGLVDFTSEEMAHIAGILQRYDDPVNAQALRDCARTIRMEHQTGTVRTEEDIMALRSRLRERKGIKE